MVPIHPKVDGKQLKVSSHQVKVKNTNASHASMAKPHAPQSSFYADYVLTWDRKGKVVAKYIGYCTKDTLIKRSVWVPTKDMLKKFDMDNAKPIKTPMPTNGHLDLNKDGKAVDDWLVALPLCI
jgi:hypothetical protein